MKITNNCALSVIVFCLTAVLGCQKPSHDDHGHHHGHGHDHEEEIERGPHRGRLLRDHSFSLELQIFETGVPPQYRIYTYDDEELISPKEVSAEVVLKRLGGRTDIFTFTPVEDFLVSEKEVEEPHSFDVTLKAKYKGEDYSWHFESYEGRTQISDEVAKLSGVVTEKAEPRDILTVAKVRGKILPSEHRIAHVIPRFPGLVREGRKHIGDKVDKGEIIAIIESNESLQPFEIRSPIAGTVISGHIVPGEFVPEKEWIYVIADLSEVWADFFVPLREQLTVRSKQKLLLSTVSGNQTAEGTVSYIAPHADEKSQSQLVRVVIPNTDNRFLPGMFVIGDLVIDESKADIAVKKSAIQTFRDWQVVFIKVGEVYEIRPLELGRTGGEWIEVLGGLASGDEYVSENAFLIKADILKSGASHDH